MGEIRNRALKLEEAPQTIQYKVAEWYAQGQSAERISKLLEQLNYHIAPSSVSRFLQKKNTQLTRMVFGTQELQTELSKEYAEVVKNFAKTSKELMAEFEDIRENRKTFKDEYQRVRALCDIGTLMRENVDFANKVLATKVTTNTDDTNVLGTIDSISATEEVKQIKKIEIPEFVTPVDNPDAVDAVNNNEGDVSDDSDDTVDP